MLEARGLSEMLVLLKSVVLTFILRRTGPGAAI